MKFSKHEYVRRFEKARALMSKQQFDALILTNHQNINYYGGITSILAGLPGAYGNVRPLIIVLPLHGDPVVIVQFTDDGNAKANSWIKDVRCWYDLPFTTTLLEEVLVEKDLYDKRIGMELSLEFHLGMPYNDFVNLQERFPKATFDDAADIIWQQRMIKSEAEIERVRRAAQITAKSLIKCLPKVEEGMTERDVARMIACTLLQEGADKVNYVSAIAGHGTYDRFCQLPTDRVIRKGELLWSDLSAICRDYCSDMSSFVVVGKETDEQKRLSDLARDVHLKSVQYIRPGLKAKDVMEFVGKCYRDAGYEWNFKIGRCGHGVGLELAEQPSLDAFSEIVLQEGMTLAFEPAILTMSGVYDMEEDIVITADGCEVLGPVWPR